MAGCALYGNPAVLATQLFSAAATAAVVCDPENQSLALHRLECIGGDMLQV